jgi:hypothetical protein
LQEAPSNGAHRIALLMGIIMSSLFSWIPACAEILETQFILRLG